MKKILIITHDINPNSGWGRYSLAIVNGLRKKGYSVDVVGETGNGLGFKIGDSKTFFSFIKNCLMIRSTIKKHDIVHALDGWPYSIYAFFGVIATSKPLFITAVGTYSTLPLNSILKGFLLKNSYLRASKILAISHFTADRLKSFIPADLIQVELLGKVILPKLNYIQNSNIKDKFRIPTDSYPVLLTVGALKRRKGQLVTLKAVAVLKDKYPNIMYCVVGDLSDKGYVEEIKLFSKTHNLEKNLMLIENAETDQDLAYLYERSDVFALNSQNDRGHFEGFGLVIIEANQFGKPAVGSMGCGIEDAICSGYNGYLTSDDPRDIAQKIVLVLEGTNPSYRTLSKNSIKWASRFSWDKTIDAYIYYYNQK